MNAFARYFEKKVEVYKRVREITIHPALIRECDRLIKLYGGREDREMYLGAEMGDWRERDGGIDGRNE